MKRKDFLNALLIIAFICFGLYYGLVANIPMANALGCLTMAFMAMAVGFWSICITIKNKFFRVKTEKISK